MHAVTPTLTTTIALASLIALLLGACATDAQPKTSDSAAIVQAAMTPVAALNPERNAYFGAVHVHTGWSFDAMTNGSKTTPDDAYAWARGKEIANSGVGGKIQIRAPLDFYTVSGHAEYMGVYNQMANPASPLSKTEITKGVNSLDPTSDYRPSGEFFAI